jgi:four helix bundle protein
MPPVRTFRDLVVWQRGMDLARSIYRATAWMPAKELYGLTSQMRRAASSIPMNVAEGYGKHTRPELVKGLRTAMGSLCELMTAYELATTMEMIERDGSVVDLLREEDRLLQALIMSLERKTRDEEESRPPVRRRRA